MQPRTYYDPAYPYTHDLDMDPRLMGFHNTLTPFAQNTSSSRLDMFASNLPQAVTLDNPDFPLIYTGWEYNLGEYEINSSRRDSDIQILEVIPKYLTTYASGGIDSTPHYLIIYKNVDANSPDYNKLDYCIVSRYFRGAEGFGHINKFTRNATSLLKKGQFIPREVVLTESPTTTDGLVKFGANLNVGYITDERTTEDAFPISQTGANKLISTSIIRRPIDLRPDQHPINLYGRDPLEFRIIPDIGEKVRDDGLLFASRTISSETAAIDSCPSTMNEVRIPYDNCIPVEPGAEVLDINVYLNVPRDKISWQSFKQLEKYVDGSAHYWESIYRVFLEHRGNCSGISNKLNTLVTTAIQHMAAMRRRIPGLFIKKPVEFIGRNRQRIGFLLIDVTLGFKRGVQPGFKITDRYGGKGVTCVVVPDDEMPIDEYGFRVDLLVDPAATVKRMNTGQLVEADLNRMSMFVARKVEQAFKRSPDEAWELLYEYYNDIRPKYAKLIAETLVTKQERIEHIKICIEKGIALNIPSGFMKIFDRKQAYIHKLFAKWGVRFAPLKYKRWDSSRQEMVDFKTKPIAIGSKYVYLLCKIPESHSVGVARINQHGIPIKPASSHIKNMLPINGNPIKAGEDELRGFTTEIPPDEIVRFIGLQANSKTGTELAIQTLLESAHPTQIDRFNISTTTLQQTSAAPALLRHLSATAGIDLSENTIAFPSDFPAFLQKYSQAPVAVESPPLMDEGRHGEVTEDDDTD